jgi:SH3-like domain-containing protein
MSQEPVALPNPGTMVVQASRAKMRSAPNRTARVVGTAVKGNQVKVVGRSGTWLEIETEGRSGWINRKLLGPR